MGSVCLQIIAALVIEPDRVHGRALYVGDDPLVLSTWVDAFSVALRGRSTRRVPGTVLAGLARAGDGLAALGLPSLITTSRFTSMTQDYPTPMGRTWEALGGRPTVSLEQGVAETTRWLDSGASAPVADWIPARGAPWARAGRP